MALDSSNQVGGGMGWEQTANNFKLVNQLTKLGVDGLQKLFDTKMSVTEMARVMA
jgi:aspartate/glutamate racemase